MLSIGRVEKTLECFKLRMRRKAEMTDATHLLLFQEIFQNTPLRLKIDIYTGLMYIMHKVEIKPFHTALKQLVLEYYFRVVFGCYLVPGILVGNIPAFARVTAQCLTGNNLRETSVIGIRGIKIVDSMLNCIVDHTECDLTINLTIRCHR